jgi:hypothetical protein
MFVVNDVTPIIDSDARRKWNWRSNSTLTSSASLAIARIAS